MNKIASNQHKLVIVLLNTFHIKPVLSIKFGLVQCELV